MGTTCNLGDTSVGEGDIQGKQVNHCGKWEETVVLRDTSAGESDNGREEVTYWRGGIVEETSDEQGRSRGSWITEGRNGRLERRRKEVRERYDRQVNSKHDEGDEL